MKNPVDNKKGVALILVLLMVSVIVVLTLQLNVSSRSQVHEAANLGDGIRVLYIAKSGLFAGMGLLSEDRGDADTLNEAWARTEALSEQSKSYFDGGYLELVIEDETGKLNINKIVAGNGFNGALKGALTRLLSQPQFQMQDREIEDLLNAIKDWIDADSEVTATGAENAYYQGLGKTYTVRNGPMESVDELLMVRGVTKELFYGTPERPGLARFLTVQGEGSININTAPKEVLRALAPSITEDAANRMDDYRRNPANSLTEPSWYRRVPGLENTAIDSVTVVTKSEYFQIAAKGHLGTMKRTIRGIVKRDSGKKLSVVAWRLG
ncbi:MAG TPA: type II secretion system minor pseudopilin GspK [Syntrophales bacterium]|nr:type II secretion system minor pseudopilin GspK [Syntrophales bacterium]